MLDLGICGCIVGLTISVQQINVQRENQRLEYGVVCYAREQLGEVATGEATGRWGGLPWQK